MRKIKLFYKPAKCDLFHHCFYVIKNQNTGEKAEKAKALCKQIIHTPTDDAEFKDVFSDVSIKHFDKGQIHMECF